MTYNFRYDEWLVRLEKLDIGPYCYRVFLIICSDRDIQVQLYIIACRFKRCGKLIN